MNALLQCLAGTPDLVSYFMNSDLFEQDLNPGNLLGSRGAVAREFQELMGIMWGGESQHRTIRPSKFKEVLAEAAQQFDGSDQHDSQEFASYLLDVLHEDLNRVRSRKPVVSFEDLVPEVIKRK